MVWRWSMPSCGWSKCFRLDWLLAVKLAVFTLFLAGPVHIHYELVPGWQGGLSTSQVNNIPWTTWHYFIHQIIVSVFLSAWKAVVSSQPALFNFTYWHSHRRTSVRIREAKLGFPTLAMRSLDFSWKQGSENVIKEDGWWISRRVQFSPSQLWSFWTNPWLHWTRSEHKRSCAWSRVRRDSPYVQGQDWKRIRSDLQIWWWEVSWLHLVLQIRRE